MNDDEQENEQSRQTHDDCTCSFSAIPAMPDSPVEFVNQRVDNQASKNLSEADTRNELNCDTKRQSIFEFHSPPGERSRPAYILFASFLI